MNVRPQTMFTGDNLPILRGMDNDMVDLIYLDPPFNSKKQWSAPIGSESAGAAFKDTWTLSDIDKADIELLEEEHPEITNLINAVGIVNGDSDKSYLLMMAFRLIEMQRVLKSTGSIFLHCDPTMSHSLKLLMDAIFVKRGGGGFMNEIIWHYGKMSNSSISFPRNHDVIFRYSKSKTFTFHVVRGGDSEYKERYKSFLTGNQVLYGSVKHKADKLIHGRAKRVRKELGRNLADEDILFDFDKEFKAQSDVIYVPIIKGNSKERTGYPTQKPLKLLEIIIESSSNIGDMILDPFCGCATTCVAAQKLNREWIGIDFSEKAIELVIRRLEKEADIFSPKIIERTDIPIKAGRISRSANIRIVLYGQQHGNCAGCGVHFPEPRHFHVDHIVPKSDGGPDDDRNLQLLCGSCNSIKGNRSMAYLLAEMKKQVEKRKK